MGDLIGPATVVIALVALIASFWSVWQARKSAQANMVSIFLEEYASKDFFESLKTLGKFYRKDHQRRFVAGLDRLRTHSDKLETLDIENARLYMDEDGEEIEPARRQVNSFYKRAWQLYNHGYLSENALSIIAGSEGTNLLFKLIRPLTLANNLAEICDGDRAKYQEELPSFKWYEEFYEFCDEGKVWPPSLINRVFVGVLLVGGVAIWILLNTKIPLTTDNMSWHPNLVTLASVMLGFGLSCTPLYRRLSVPVIALQSAWRRIQNR